MIVRNALVNSTLLMIALAGILAGATPQECAAFLDQGWVFDRDSVFLSRDDYQLVQTYFSRNSFHSKQQAHDAGGTLSLGIDEILSLDFGGHKSDTEYDMWQDSLLHTTYSEISDKLQYVNAVEHVSRGLTSVLQSCLDSGGLSFVLIPGANFNAFTLQAKFIPINPGLTKGKGKVSVQPPDVVHCNPPLEKNVTIDVGGISLLCSRPDGTDITAVLNSSTLGTRNVKFAAHIIPPPTATLKVSDAQIKAGQQITIEWNTTDSHAATLEPGFGAVQLSGKNTVTPAQDTDFRLTAIGDNGAQVSSSAHVHVIPLINVTQVTYWFHTNDNDKDWDTQVGTELICNGKTIASRFDFNHDKHVDHWDNNSDHGPWAMSIASPMTEDDMPNCKYRISTSGSDTWNFTAHLDLHLSNNTVRSFVFPNHSFRDQHSEIYPLQ